MEKNKEELRYFAARMDDLAADAARDGFAAGKFMPPETQALFSGRFPSSLSGAVALEFHGGYSGAERALPLFYDASLGYDEEARAALAGILPLEIRTASGNPISHRQILGSLLSLGVERETLGDILPFEEGRAVFFTLFPLASFFQEQLQRVGGEKVECRETVLPRNFTPLRKTAELPLTVASLRVDCLAAALLHLSREKAQALVRAGLLSVNHRPVADPSAPFRTGDRITVRGEGRFDILRAEEESRTRSGRIRLTALRYLD